jgi:hypothetical protein
MFLGSREQAVRKADMTAVMKTWEGGGVGSPFLTSALSGGGLSASRSGIFSPGKSPRYPLGRKLGGPQSR